MLVSCAVIFLAKQIRLVLLKDSCLAQRVRVNMAFACRLDRTRLTAHVIRRT